MTFKGNLKIEGVTKVKVITPKEEALSLNIEMSDDGKTLSLIVENPKDLIDADE